MLIMWSGQPTPADGFYVDEHGHRLFLRCGDPAPICVYTGAAVIRWQLFRPLGPIPR